MMRASFASPQRAQHFRVVRGFTLIELMITLVVAAILSALAVSAYTRYIERAKRAEAQSRLFEIAMQLERSYTLNGVFPAALPATLDTAVPVGAVSSSRTYQIGYAMANNSYTLSATPVNAQGADECGVFSITDANEKYPAGSALADSCWRR